MTRYGMVIGFEPETEEKYKQYHAAVWPGVGNDQQVQHPQLFQSI